MSDGNQNSVDSNEVAGVKPLLAKVLAVVFAFTISIFSGLALFKIVFTSPFVELYAAENPVKIRIVAKQLAANKIAFRTNERQDKILVEQEDLLQAKLLIAGSLESDNIESTKNDNENRAARIKIENESASNITEGSNTGKNLESELAKTIASINNVRASRVHLAMPTPDNSGKQQARASVVLQLVPGKEITQSQVSAITHLVSSSVTGLAVKNVTVIDQNGRLLKSTGSINNIVLSTAQFEYKTAIEADFKARIDSFLGPFLGEGTYKVQVSVELTKNYKRSGSLNFGGGVEQGDAEETGISNKISASTTNDLKRLTVAVVVDNKEFSIDDGKFRRIARTKEEMAKISDLVKKAVSYNRRRGDRVEIVNIPFTSTSLDSKSKASFFDSDGWFVQSSKLIFIILAFVLVFWLALKSALFLMRKIFRNFQPMFFSHNNNESGKSSQADKDQVAAQESINYQNYRQRVMEVHDIVERDPKLVAQVIRSWVQEDAQRA